MKYPHLTSRDAAKILKRVKPEHSFKLHSGSDIQNLQGMAEALKLMSDSTFRHHVTKERNDFSSWVIDVVGDEELADSIRKAHNKDSMRRLIEERIKFLETISSEQGLTGLFIRRPFLDFAVGFLVGIAVGLLVAKLF